MTTNFAEEPIAREDVVNPYVIGSPAAQAFDDWIAAHCTLIDASKQVMHLAQLRQQALEAHMTRIRVTRSRTDFLWHKQDEYVQALAAERDAIHLFAQAEQRVADLVGHLPVINLKW